MGGLIASLIVGGIAGWLAGMIMKGKGLGILMNIVIGIIGGVLGGWLFGLFGAGLGAGIIGSVITATIGAVILLWIISKFSALLVSAAFVKLKLPVMTVSSSTAAFLVSFTPFTHDPGMVIV